MAVRVSVPSSGDYQFLRVAAQAAQQVAEFPSPHPGIINFFLLVGDKKKMRAGFRPLIRGLSISSQSGVA